jgi:hypothetical protein
MIEYSIATYPRRPCCGIAHLLQPHRHAHHWAEGWTHPRRLRLRLECCRLRLECYRLHLECCRLECCRLRLECCRLR